MSFELILDSQGVIGRPRLNPPATDAHKYDRGHAVVISGPALATGASRLAALAALGVGAGLVSLIGDPAALTEHSAHLTAIMLKAEDPSFRAINDRVSAIAIGPGAGTGENVAGKILALLDRKIAMVIDADGLTCFEKEPDRLFKALHENVVLTPHSGEFARLFPDIVQDDRQFAAARAAERAGGTLVLKGSVTQIASSDGQKATNHHASPWLATAGSGDALTGLICGLLAQGQSAFEAACIASWLHGDIGVRFGPGLTADKMIDQLPLVLRDCLAD